MDRQWTKQQLMAMESVGGDVLVSASAGSGKTAVLTQRVLQQITDAQSPIALDRLLIVTFTKAAAAEMKSKISDKLSEALDLYPEDQNLVLQQSRLDLASISTIDSFCAKLVKSYFGTLGLPSDIHIDVRLCDELSRRVLQDLLSEQYKLKSPEFEQTVKTLTHYGHEEKMETIISRLYGIIRNFAFYQHYFNRFSADYNPELPFENTQWFLVLKAHFIRTFDYCRRLAEKNINLCQIDENVSKSYLNTSKQDYEQFDELIRLGQSCTWDELSGAVMTVEYASLKRYSGKAPEAEMIKTNRNNMKAAIKTLQGIAFIDQSAYKSNIESLAPIVNELFYLLEQYDRLLSAEKLERSVMDFADLEHYTLRLLYEDLDSETPTVLSETGRQICHSYDAVYIDEYQDVSDIQEGIFRAFELAKVPRFMVGDVKQSIYRFRMAKPEIFIEKKDMYHLYEESNPLYPAKIFLSNNFRTRKEITGFINNVCHAVMSEQIGGMNYDQEDYLIASADYDESQNNPVQVCIVNQKPKQDEYPEAEFVANEILSLLKSKKTVKGDKDTHVIRPEDICILVRNKTHVQDYLDAIENRGIPCFFMEKPNILQCKEIACLVSYMKILTNPMLDLELFKVLASPLYGLTSNDLAMIRAQEKKDKAFKHLTNMRDKISGLAKFLDDYQLIRFFATKSSVTDSIRFMISTTGMNYIARAISDDAEKNLLLLMEYADSFESRGDPSLSGFVNYLYLIEERSVEMPAAAVTKKSAVSIMTIHKSKGLEFPVVFLAEANAGFSFLQKDAREDVFLNQKLGFGCEIKDIRSLSRNKTLPLFALQQQSVSTSISEEICLLYVAMTRAKEQLYIVAKDVDLGILKKSESILFMDDKMDPFAAQKAKSYYEWIAPVILRRSDFDDAYRTIPVGRIATDGKMKVRIINDWQQVNNQEKLDNRIYDADMSMLENLEKSVAFSYPHLDDIKTPIRVPVSEIAEKKLNLLHAFVKKPRFITHQDLNAADKGIAIHKYFQFASFEKANMNPMEELERLVQQGFLSKNEKEVIDVSLIQNFFDSNVGKLILSADKLYREMRLLCSCTPQELKAIDPLIDFPSSVIVEGIADCVVWKENNVYLIDYKTDRIQTDNELIDRYGTQLKLYRFLLEQTVGVSVKEMMIYSFSLNHAVICK